MLLLVMVNKATGNVPGLICNKQESGMIVCLYRFLYH